MKNNLREPIACKQIKVSLRHPERLVSNHLRSPTSAMKVSVRQLYVFRWHDLHRSAHKEVGLAHVKYRGGGC